MNFQIFKCETAFYSKKINLQSNPKEVPVNIKRQQIVYCNKCFIIQEHIMMKFCQIIKRKKKQGKVGSKKGEGRERDTGKCCKGGLQ